VSTERDLSGRVRSWLREDGHEDADRVLNLVLDQLDTTPQRHAGWLARRFPIMRSTTFRFGIAAAAVLILAFIGYQFLPGMANGGPSSSTSPSPSVAPTLETTPIPFPTTSGDLAAGSYHMSDSHAGIPVGLAFTVPDGWRADVADSFVRKGSDDATSLVFAPWSITHVYADACHWQGTLEAVGPTADDLATALEAIGGVVWSDRSEPPGHSNIDSYTAIGLSFAVPSDFDASGCDQGIVRLWADTGGSEGGGWLIHPGQTVDVYVVDAGGTPVALVATSNSSNEAADINELTQIVRSVRFDR